MTDTAPKKYEDAEKRDPDPRGPDAPEKELQHEERGLQLPELLGEPPELSTGKAMRHYRARLAAVVPPGMTPQFTTYNYDPGRGGYGVAGVVIHTVVGTLASAWGRFSQPNQASAHYGVPYNGGSVRQWVAEGNTAWHCGRYIPDASHMANRNSIGIEHEDMGLYNSPRPDGLYETTARLVAWICERYGLPITHNTVRGECGHREVSVQGTACPDSLDVDRIIRRANEIRNPAPPAPTWRDSFHREDFFTQLSHQVTLYDVTTKAQFGTIGAGPFSSAYRGSYNGEDWRMTAFSYDHSTPHAVKTADVTPPPPPPLVPEWKRNLQPAHDSYTLVKPVPLVNLETGATKQLLPAGPLTVDWRTSVGGTSYRMTAYSHDKDLPNGVPQAAIDAAVAPVPPTPTPTPPGPEPPPEPPPGALNWVQALLDWLKRIFGG